MFVPALSAPGSRRLVAGLAMTVLVVASGCTVDLSLGDGVESQAAEWSSVEDVQHIDSCFVRATEEEFGDDPEICFVGDFTGGRVTARGLQDGSDLVIRDSTGQRVVLPVSADEGVDTPDGVSFDVEVGFTQNTRHIDIEGTWFDGEDLDFSVVG